MAEETDNLVIELLRKMRAENAARFDEIDAHIDAVDSVLKEVRVTVTSLDLRFEALDERVETIREGAVQAIGYAAHASRGHVDLRKQVADLPRRVEKLEAGR